MGGLRPTNCDIAAAFLCVILASIEEDTYYDKCIWYELSGCAVGYYLPDEAPEPSFLECNSRIFEEIIEQCATDSRFNAGSVNVRQLPDWGDDGTAIRPHHG